MTCLQNFRAGFALVALPLLVASAAGCVNLDDPNACDERVLEGECGVDERLRMSRTGDNALLGPLAEGAHIDVSISRIGNLDPLRVTAADVVEGTLVAERIDDTTLRLTATLAETAEVEVAVAGGRVDTFELETRAIASRAAVIIPDDIYIGAALVELDTDERPKVAALPGATLLVKEERYDAAGERLFGKLQPGWTEGEGVSVAPVADNVNRAEIRFDPDAEPGTYDVLDDPEAGELTLLGHDELDRLELWTGSFAAPAVARLDDEPAPLTIELRAGDEPELLVVLARDPDDAVALPPADEAIDLRIDGGDSDLVRVASFETLDALEIEVAGEGTVTGTLTYAGFEIPVTLELISS